MSRRRGHGNSNTEMSGLYELSKEITYIQYDNQKSGRDFFKKKLYGWVLT